MAINLFQFTIFLKPELIDYFTNTRSFIVELINSNRNLYKIMNIKQLSIMFRKKVVLLPN